MDLQEFVTETLRQIMDGVKAAKEYGKTVGADVNPSGGFANVAGISGTHLYRRMGKQGGYKFAQNVSFDVAVTTTEESQKEGGAKLSIAAISIGGAKQTETMNSSVSRVEFNVPLFLP